MIDILKDIIENFQAWFRLTSSYIKKTKPAESFYVSCVNFIKNILTASKKLKIAKYRVNHLRYRLNQMEQLIEANNPNSYEHGRMINLIR